MKSLKDLYGLFGICKTNRSESVELYIDKNTVAERLQWTERLVAKSAKRLFI